MLATNNPTLSQTLRPSTPSDEYDRQLLAGALSALSTLAVIWLRRAGRSPSSQTYWDAVSREHRDDVLDATLDAEIRDVAFEDFRDFDDEVSRAR